MSFKVYISECSESDWFVGDDGEGAISQAPSRDLLKARMVEAINLLRPVNSPVELEDIVWVDAD